LGSIHEFQQGGGDGFTGFGFHSVDKKDALKMIHFVLKGSGQKPAGVKAYRLSLKVLIIHSDAEASADSPIDVGKTKASLVCILSFSGQS